MNNDGMQMERLAQEVAGSEFLAGVEATTIAGQFMEWMESAALIQGQAFQYWVDDWQRTIAAMPGVNAGQVWFEHVGRRMSHISESVLALQALNEREFKRMLSTHAALLGQTQVGKPF